ncbi:hypothetical protein DFH94DRAFT_653225 [Russula ochroleuca]|uniref:G-patch domain-containing protein n=1 Tax=Russula ochroleuca TaxID=152965 RepID=A0A9P5MTC9_9AGAM|nr:hypothetical protein DFH94DRAFT_653225 [Russula ochroleuca]
MPLDGHAFLLGQGWSGTGQGLRKGAITRPITAPQKKNLAGIGKDRADAFPFWDHLFTVAASAIQIECFSSDDDEDSPRSDAKDTRSSSKLELRQTSTGILSNRPPIVGTPCVSSGATTPTISESSSAPRLSLLALAKRETARRGLYSRFFRGPILGPDVQSESVKTEPTATPQLSFQQDDIKESTKQIDADEEDALKKECDGAEERREERLRKEAERAARKRKRQDAKNNAKDQKDIDERVLPLSREQGSGLLISTGPGEVQSVKRKKKKKRLKPAPVDDKLDEQTPVSTDKRTLEGEDHGMPRREDRSRQRRRRDKYR